MTAPEPTSSTPVRGGCKRFQSKSSPIVRNDCVKRRNIINDDCDFNFNEKDFEEEFFDGKINVEPDVINETDSNSNKNNQNSSKTSSNQVLSSFAQSMLSVDDDFLRGVNCETPVSNSQSNDSRENQNFQLSLFPQNFQDDDSDHAWDMSVSVEINHENCIKNTCQSSQELHKKNTTFKWEDDSLLRDFSETIVTENENKEVSNTHKIKSILLNNALNPLTCCRPSGSPKVFNSQKSSNSTTSTFFGLPMTAKLLIKKYKGISELYDWQEECLKLDAVKERKNLVYALPTSGGKTLVAEILILQEILCRQKNVLFILPYVSIVQEKVRALSSFALELGFFIEEYCGGKGQYPPQKRRRKNTVFIATIEKSLGLIHSYLETERMSEVGLVVVDELHLIGESRRGACLEAMLAKLMFSSSAQHVQVVGMSATIGNINEVAKFLKADVYTHNFRPVELTEYIKTGDDVFLVKSNEDPPFKFHSKKSFPYSPELKQLDPDEIGGLVKEVAPNESCLLFCSTKKNCENAALLICKILDRELLKHKVQEKTALYKALESEGNGIVCNILCKTLPYGVAYHNSGLTNAERKLLEEAFCAKTIFCICCTSTLAAGVNLPAKRVILRAPYIGRDFINLSRYKQMVGRAGRAGLSGGAGESFLLCQQSDVQKVGELLRSPMDCCKSQLFENESLSSFILSAIGLSIATSRTALNELLKGTLLFIQNDEKNDLDTLINATVVQLVKQDAVQITKIEDSDIFNLTIFGKASMKGNLDVETAIVLLKDLKTAKNEMVLQNHLHLLYLVTPYSMLDQIKVDRQVFISKFMKLSPNELQVANVLGIDERYITCLVVGRGIKEDLQQKAHRFYLSLMLQDLWNERSVWSVSVDYQVNRGLIHTLLSATVSFAGSVLRFCNELEDMWALNALLPEITSRLSYCCKPELIPLMDLPAVKLGRARQLYNAGFKTINEIAKAGPKALVEAVDHLPRRVAYQIVAAAKLKLMTTTETLQEEAVEKVNDFQNEINTWQT